MHEYVSRIGRDNGKTQVTPKTSQPNGKFSFEEKICDKQN